MSSRVKLLISYTCPVTNRSRTCWSPSLEVTGWCANDVMPALHKLVVNCACGNDHEVNIGQREEG